MDATNTNRKRATKTNRTSNKTSGRFRINSLKVEEIILKLKNSDIKGLANFLIGEKLSGKRSRMRTRFVKVLNERLKEIDEFRIELLDKHSKKDDEGQPIIKDNAYILEDQKAFNEEYAELMNEDFVIDETESKREMLQHVKAILENTEKEFEGVEAFQYDEWCEVFENLKYEDKTKSE